MSGDLNTAVSVDLEGNLSREAKRAERAIERLTTRSARNFAHMKAAVSGFQIP